MAPNWQTSNDLVLKPIDYQRLNARQKEAFNFHKVAALLADYGFNCIKLSDDWQGADFLAYHNDGKQTLKVQLKGRVTIAKKYEGKSIYMAFPIHTVWHLVPHKKLVQLISANTDWCSSSSWTASGAYSSAAPNQKLKEALSPYRLNAHVVVNDSDE